MKIFLVTFELLNQHHQKTTKNSFHWTGKFLTYKTNKKSIVIRYKHLNERKVDNILYDPNQILNLIEF
ncbi:hypothetical protein CoNPh17_CDS0162 [Staphylococcus phage S-CoN_Ph17]|nr:hypothetical protein CoNPh17_CDS0162 [Staphylococcus phage S-CoN_Ph17]